MVQGQGTGATAQVLAYGLLRYADVFDACGVGPSRAHRTWIGRQQAGAVHTERHGGLGFKPKDELRRTV